MEKDQWTEKQIFAYIYKHDGLRPGIHTTTILCPVCKEAYLDVRVSAYDGRAKINCLSHFRCISISE